MLAAVELEGRVKLLAKKTTSSRACSKVWYDHWSPVNDETLDALPSYERASDSKFGIIPKPNLHEWY